MNRYLTINYDIYIDNEYYIEIKIRKKTKRGKQTIELTTVIVIYEIVKYTTILIILILTILINNVFKICLYI